MEADPQLVTARSQWQQVMGKGSGGVDASRTVKTGTFLGKFVGLKQIHSADRDLRSSIMQASLLHFFCQQPWSSAWNLYCSPSRNLVLHSNV